MQITNQDLRIAQLETALETAIEALEGFLGGDDSETLKYLRDVLQDDMAEWSE